MIFVSVFAYALGKLRGPRGWELEVQLGLTSKWPGFRTLYHARGLDDVGLHVDCSTFIDKARCRAAGFFLSAPPSCDVWLSIDDDVDAPREALESIVARVRETKGVVCQEMEMRQGGSNVELSLSAVPGEPFLPARRAGAALSAYHRDAIQRLAMEADVWFQDRPDGPNLPGLFRSHIERRVWVGEDIDFCNLARLHGVTLEARIARDVEHAKEISL